MYKVFIYITFLVFALFAPIFRSTFVWAVDCNQCQVTGCVGVGCNTCGICNGYSSGKPLGTFRGLGALSDFISSLGSTDPTPAANAFSNFISKAIGVMTVIAIIWFIFTLFLGAIAWISSGGDKVKLQNAQKQITTALTGLIIVIAALFLVKLIGIIFGIDILNITNMINSL